MNSDLRRNSYNTISNQRAFTLVEALVVLLIAGILISFGVPQFDLVIKNNRIVAATNQIVGVVNYARIEAVKRGNSVHFGPDSADPNVGWVAWIDDGDDAPGDVNDEVLRV